MDRVYSDMTLLSDTCRVDDFRYMLAQPTLPPSRKCSVAEAVLKAHLSNLSLSMVTLVIRNKRENYLPGIARYYGELYRKAKGIKRAQLVTAQPVDESVKDKIRNMVRKSFKSEVELTSRIEENLIGGFTLTIGDQQYDASVASSLKKMKKQLLQTHTEKK